MGYRSDVAYVIKFESFEKRNEFVALMLAKNNGDITQAIGEVKHDYKDNPIITFECTDVKWYPDYADVQAHEYLYKQAHELFGADYRFLTVGEDGAEEFDEVDEHGQLYEYISTVHRIDTNFGE